MNKEELAKALDGIKYGDGISKTLTEKAKENNLVIAYGASDDLLILEGALDDEIGADNGVMVYINSKGKYDRRKRKVKNGVGLNATFSPKSNPDLTWDLFINANHSKFSIMEDGEVFCYALVFSLDDLPKPATKFVRILEMENGRQVLLKISSNPLQEYTVKQTTIFNNDIGKTISSTLSFTSKERAEEVFRDYSEVHAKKFCDVADGLG